MAGAEIVEREAGAELADALEHLRGVLRVLHHQRFGQLELERAAREARAREHRAQVVDQILPQQLARRHVDAGEDRIALRAPCAASAELARGALQHEQAEIDDQADLLGDGDELRRRHAAHLGMVPARQRLEAGDRAVLEPHDRLIEDRDLLALERAAQVRFERQAVGLARAHRRLEHLDAVAADALGVIHRELGVLEHLLGAVRLAVGKRDADRGGEEDLAVVERDRRAQRAAQRLGEGDDALRLPLRQQDQRELVAGEPRQRVLRLQQPAEPARQRQQDRIADRDADRIVDLLEAVEIDHHHGRADRLDRPWRAPAPLRAGRRTARGSAGR